MAAPSNRSGLVEAAVGRWNSSHPRSQQIDLQAELRVAGVEGLSGEVGDGGHAFGPNQANDAGGTLTGKLPRGWTPEQKNEWAWSPKGLDFQLAGVAAAAGGQHGPRAVENIIRLYERPADPNGEVARALGGSVASAPAGASGSSATVGGPTVGTGAPDSRRQFAQQLLAAISPTGQLDNAGLVGALQTRQQSLPVPAAFAPAPAPASTGGHFSSVDGVQVDPLIASQLQQLISRFGVTPTSGYRDPAHNAQVGGAGNSDHLRGDAVDFSGTPAALAALYKYAQGRFPYVEPMAQAKNHVHISFRRPSGPSV